jgi:hypothetical protein
MMQFSFPLLPSSPATTSLKNASSMSSKPALISLPNVNVTQNHNPATTKKEQTRRKKEKIK